MTQPWYAIANEAEVPSPALLVYPERIAANIDRTIALAGGAGRLRPHVKTHKMPEVVQMQLDRGIGKFKAATIAEAEMTATAGAEDVLLVYPAVGPTATRLCGLAALFPRTRFRALPDCDAGISMPSTATRGPSSSGTTTASTPRTGRPIVPAFTLSSRLAATTGEHSVIP
jgi:D-serine deaminase-like pyridoxal phosphate-dependent protein